VTVEESMTTKRWWGAAVRDLRAAGRRWLGLLTAGSSVTSFPRYVRVGIGLAACALPAMWLVRLATSWGDAAAALSWAFVVIFAAPLVVILPGLRHRPDHTDLRGVAEFRLQRHLDSVPDDDPEPSRFAHRAAPPRRW
jgi:hypothetical protein